MILDNKNNEKDILKDHSRLLKAEEEPGVKYRRIRNVLSTAGFGVIAFGIWSIIRVVLRVAFSRQAQPDIDPNELDSMISQPGDDVKTFLLVLLILVIVFAAIEIALRLFVGLSARSEGRGKKKSIAYVIVAGILIPYYILSVIYNFMSFDYVNGIVDNIISMIMDITSTIALIEVFVAAIRIRVMRKKYGTEIQE